jgi:hypothetical protein
MEFTWREWREFEELARVDPIARAILHLRDELDLSPMQTLLQYALAKHQQVEHITQEFVNYVSVTPRAIYVVPQA